MEARAIRESAERGAAAVQATETIINIGSQPDEVTYVAKLCADWACTLSWIDHWQTLLGAAIALPLTFLAIMIPWLIEDQKDRRRFAAMRASMPLRLSQVSNYATSTMKALAEVRSHLGTAGVTLEKPELPGSLVDGLERTIEAIGKKRVVMRLSNIIGEIQVIEARMSGLDLEHEVGANVDSYLIQAATIHAQADSLYDFARRRASNTPARITWGNIRTAFHIAKVYDAHYPDVHAFVGRLEALKSDPEDNDPRMSHWMKLRLWWAMRIEEAQEWWKKRHGRP